MDDLVLFSISDNGLLTPIQKISDDIDIKFHRVKCAKTTKSENK